jgi:DNA-binding PadR family transcriptional regulator
VVRGAEHATGEVTGEVLRLLMVMKGEMKRQEIQAGLDLKHDEHFRKAYLVPTLQDGLIEMTVPDKPHSSKQKYRLTDKGQRVLRGIAKV